MTNTTQEFKVGDKFIVTRKSFRDQGYSEVYTVSEVNTFGTIQFRNHDNEEALVYTNEIEHYTPEPQKHIHHDLIVAWAKDPKGCIIQFKDDYNQWTDTFENKPTWVTKAQYRIKPKTKEVQRWKWVVEQLDGDFFVPRKYYTEEEVKKEWSSSAVSLTKLEQSVLSSIEEI